MRTIFIVNPNAGKQSSLKAMQKLVKDTGIVAEFMITEYPGHAAEFLQKLEDECLIFAVGGDGTLSEIAGAARRNAVRAPH